jgi:hypothetical protein
MGNPNRIKAAAEKARQENRPMRADEVQAARS